MWRKELQQDTLDGRQQQRSFIRFLNRYWSDVDQNENLSKACPCFLGPNPASRNQSVHLFRHSRLLIIDGWAKGNLLSVTVLLGNLSQLPGLEIELIILKAFFTKRKMCVCVFVCTLCIGSKKRRVIARVIYQNYDDTIFINICVRVPIIPSLTRAAMSKKGK